MLISDSASKIVAINNNWVGIFNLSMNNFKKVARPNITKPRYIPEGGNKSDLPDAKTDQENIDPSLNESVIIRYS
jgi:hypothetical protein